jgi:hypothetical protein
MIDGVPSRAVLSESTMPETVSAARRENACTAKLRDRSGLSGRIRVSQSANQPKPTTSARTNHPILPIVM